MVCIVFCWRFVSIMTYNQYNMANSFPLNSLQHCWRQQNNFFSLNAQCIREGFIQRGIDGIICCLTSAYGSILLVCMTVCGYRISCCFLAGLLVFALWVALLRETNSVGLIVYSQRARDCRWCYVVKDPKILQVNPQSASITHT